LKNKGDADGEMEEIKGKRTRTSKTHDLGGGKFALDASIGSVHYQDALGEWQEINNEWHVGVLPFNWQMTEAGYQVRVKEGFNVRQVIEFEVEGETVALQPMSLEWTNDLEMIQSISMPQAVDCVVSNLEVDLLPAVGVPSKQGTIRWNNAYGSGIDFEWKCTPSRLCKVLEISDFGDLPVPAGYIMSGGNPCLRLNLIFAPSKGVDILVDNVVWDKKSKKTTFDAVKFVKGGEVLWGFMPLLYWGSDVGGFDNEGMSGATIERKGNSYYISIRVPYEWLETATFPVYIDTDVDEQVGASTDDGWQAEGFGTLNLNGTTLNLTSGTSEWTRVWIGACFTGSLPPNAAEITACYVSLNIENDGSDDMNGDLYFEDGAGGVTFATGANDILNRTRTTATTPWVADSLGTGWKNSDSMVGAAQEIVTDYTLTSIVLIGKPKTDAAKEGFAYSWDQAGNVSGPKLHMEYTAGGGGVPMGVLSIDYHLGGIR